MVDRRSRGLPAVTFADKVIGIALDPRVMPLANQQPKLAGAAVKLKMDGVIWQHLWANVGDDLVRQHPTDYAVCCQWATARGLSRLV